MRRWNGTRWVEYAPGEKQPDEASLLDVEACEGCRAGRPRLWNSMLACYYHDHEDGLTTRMCTS